MEYEDSSDSSPEVGEELETAEILGEKIEIPKGIAEHIEIFNEVLNVETWKSLSQADQEHLWKFLPTFPEDNNAERRKTLSMLFNRENFKYESPLNTFHEKLQRGYFRPDIAQLLRMVKRSERKQFKDQRKRWYFKLLQELIVDRREFLEVASNTSAGPIKVPSSDITRPHTAQSLRHRAHKRYLRELSAVRSEVGEFSQSSEDESCEAGFSLSKKHASDMKPSRKSLSFELDSSEISEETYRNMVSAYRKKMSSHQRRTGSSATSHRTVPREASDRIAIAHRRSSVRSMPDTSQEKQKRRPSSTCSTPVPKHRIEPPPADLDNLIKPILKEKDSEPESEATKIKSEESGDEEVQQTLDRSEGDKTIDVESASPTNIPQNQKLMENQAQPQQIIMRKVPPQTSQITPATPALLSAKEEEESKILFNEVSELINETATHKCFFSLLRDIICASRQHRIRCDILERRIKSWEANASSHLNDWFTLVDEPWINCLDSALKFLSGEYPVELQPEDYVPYIELKQTMKYQWIGAGRDTDSHLLPLCSHWLDHRDEITIDPILDFEDMDLDVAEQKEEPMEEIVPPPRCRTDWIVRPSTLDEKTEFQRQERLRFQNPARAFTYRMHGYESVVGPVKGIYSDQTSSVLKPRGRSLLVQIRPTYITILALVRDAAARLPNGEGTRADMCTLIRDSQYLIDASESTLQGVVSGALDRLHYEVDSCVRFDTKRKIWVYLHRRRSESDMEKIHQHYQGKGKMVKKPAKKKPTKKPEGKEGAEKGGRKPKAPAMRAMKLEKEEGEVTFCDLQAGEVTEADPSKDAAAASKALLASSSSVPNRLSGSFTPAQKPSTVASANPGLPAARSATLPEGKPAPLPESLLKPQQPPVSAPLLMNNLAGTQFVTTTGQKVQFITAPHQNIGQIQSIQLNSGQNIFAHNIQGQAGANILQNLQQVQFLTSNGQIISRTMQGVKTVASTSPMLKSVPAGAAARLSAGDQRAASPKPPTVTVAKGNKNIRNISTDGRPTISLLTSQPRTAPDKDAEKKKMTGLTGLQMVTKPGTKLTPQIINVSGLHLLNKPQLTKTNASVLTGVKLVNTQQGVKMVATSATTVVQGTLPSPKVTATMAKGLPSTSIASSHTFTQRANPHMINVDALVQGARANVTTNKGQASLIQLPTSSGNITQYALLGSQSNLQPRIVQAQQIRSIVSTAGAQAKPNIRMALTGIKPVILAKPQQQSQGMILTTDSSTAGGLGQTLVLSSQAPGRANPGSAPVAVVQPQGGQQILLPTNFNATTCNMKNISGLKLVPISVANSRFVTRMVKPTSTTQQPSTSVEPANIDDKQ